MSVMDNYAEFRDACDRFTSAKVDFEFGTPFKREGDWLVRADDVKQHLAEGVLVDAVNGNVSSEDERTALRDAGYEDWEAVTGFSGQHGYDGPAMHPSEQFSGNMAAAIWQDAEPGDRFVLIYLEAQDVDGNGEPLDPDADTDGYGWMLLKRPADADGKPQA